MSRFIDQRFEDLVAYVPGEQPQDRRYIKLNTNEMPYPPSEGVIKAVTAGAKGLNLYPDPQGLELKNRLAGYYGVRPENVFLSNGSDEVLSFIFMSFFDKGVAFADITYGFYSVYSDLYGINAKVMPLRDDFTVDVREYAFSDTNVVIANPNAPTGIALKKGQIEYILQNNSSLVVIDEAYADFGNVSCIDLTEKYDNLIVVRTYSKSRAMAGARLGFAIGNEEIIKDLEKIKYSTNPYNINRLTLAAGTAALDDDDYYADCINKVRNTRSFLVEELRNLGFNVLDSSANFVFAMHPNVEGKLLYEKLKSAGVLVRHFDSERIKNYVRITVGTQDETEKLLRETERILEV